jgi:chromosome segregation ATPase
MKATTERHVALMKEQDGLVAEIVSSKSAAAAAKSDYDKISVMQTAKINDLSSEIAKLEKAKTALEDEQAVRDRLNTAMVAEVAAAKKEMLAEVDKDVAKAKGKLLSLNASVEAAEVELAALVEKKRLFIASLG